MNGQREAWSSRGEVAPINHAVGCVAIIAALLTLAALAVFFLRA
jgi:hypothetical protein